MITRLCKASVSLVALGIAASAVAADLPGTGSLSGTVTADKPFQAAKIYAVDSKRNVTYMVYTAKGQYKAVDMFPGTYDVSVEKAGFASDPQKVTISAGGAASANFKLRTAPMTPNSAGREGNSKMVLAGYEEIYPPGAGRQIAERTCMRCHGVNWLSERPQPEVGWTAMVDQMINMSDGASWGIKGGSPVLPKGEINAEQRVTLIKYLAANMGADKPPRQVRIDEPIPLDEAQLGKAMWVEYSVTPQKTPDGRNRWIQEPYFDTEGNVWLTERTRGAPAIVRLDPRTATFKAYPTPVTTWSPHGIVVDPVNKENVWFAGEGVYVGRLNSKTGEFKPYGFDGPGGYGGHTPAWDSTGDLWFSMLPDDKIGRWDRQTDTIKTWKNPTPSGRPYGLLVDQNDKIWYVQFYTCKVTRFDPVTEKFTEFAAPSTPCSVRRLGLDSKGQIWYGAFSTGKLGVLNPATGQMKEWLMSRFAEPYDAWVDPSDNVWMGDGGRGGLLIKFDPKTERFTNYPSPKRSDMPKLAITGDGAIWYSNRSYASRGAGPATVGVLYPDMSRIKTLGAFYAMQNGRAVGSGSPRPVVK